MNAVVAIYIYTLVPEFLMRFMAWILIHTVYRLQQGRPRAHPGRRARASSCATTCPTSTRS